MLRPLRAPLPAVLLATLLTACGGGDGSTDPSSVASIALASPAGTSLQVGDRVLLTATARDASGSTVGGVGFAWSTSQASVATVSASGEVVAVGQGFVTITAAAGSATGTLNMSVVQGSSPVVDMPGLSFVPFTTVIPVGGTVRFSFPSLEHNVIFERKTGAPADISVRRNTTVARTFPVAGSFPYDCTLHPGMSGVIDVRP